MSYEEEDICMSYEEEEEDTCLIVRDSIHPFLGLAVENHRYRHV